MCKHEETGTDALLVNIFQGVFAFMVRVEKHAAYYFRKTDRLNFARALEEVSYSDESDISTRFTKYTASATYTSSVWTP